jgi:hypothetical protein
MHSVATGGTYGRLTSTDPVTWNRAWVDLARFVSLIVAGVAALLILVELGFWAITAPLPGFAPLIVYLGACVVVNVIIWLQAGLWSQQLATSGYGPVRDSLIIWGILGLVFGLVSGLVLLVVLLRRHGYLAANVASYPGAPPAIAFAPALPTPPPPPYPSAPGAPMAAPPPMVAAPTPAPAMLCPRCHLPMSFVPQYQRNYCYHCQLYA